jgi:hypothetical protein
VSQDYIQHLSVSRDLEMAEAVRNVGRLFGNAWKGVKEAAAKKRAENKRIEENGTQNNSKVGLTVDVMVINCG